MILFRIVQNSESNDLYPLCVPVLYEPSICSQRQYKCGCRLACAHAKWMQLAQNCVQCARFGISCVEPSGFGTKGICNWKVKS